jgi:hypothetical protein
VGDINRVHPLLATQAKKVGSRRNSVTDEHLTLSQRKLIVKAYGVSFAICLSVDLCVAKNVWCEAWSSMQNAMSLLSVRLWRRATDEQRHGASESGCGRTKHNEGLTARPAWP